MNKKERLQALLSKLNSLENKEVLPDDEIKNLIKDEVLGFAKELKGSPTVRVLQKFNQDLDKFKKDFDLKPISDSIKELEVEITENQKVLIAEFETGLTSKLEEFTNNLEKVRQSIPKLPDPFNSSELEKNIASLRDQILAKQDFDSGPLQKDLDNIQKQLQNLVENDIQADNKLREELEKKIEKKVDQLRKDFNSRFSNLGGGSQNQQININSSVMSLKYADINFKNSTTIGWTAANDETNKRVNITASIISGGGGGGTGTLADVSAASTDATKSTYTMTSSVPVEFESSDNNTLLYLDEANEMVGIGTNAPQNRLEILAAAGQGINFRIPEINDNASFLRFITGTGSLSNNNQVAGVGSRITQADPSTLKGDLVFYTNSGDSFDEVMRVMSNGRVGIGTNNPGVLLQLGKAGTLKGVLNFAGNTSGLVTIQPAAAAGTWTMTLPVDDGSAGQYLVTDGGGVTQWASVTATGGSGITRTTSIISVSSTLGDATATDYAIFANVGIRVTLPTAINNLNLYTVKNVSASSILVAAATGQDIDGSAMALMPTQYESLSFISNGSVWGVV